MITREELRRLAQLESAAGSAVSFYFQPQTPQDRSHREEAIFAKDLVREALRRANRGRNQLVLRDDLNRILQAAEGLHGNHSRGKAIFACRELGIWRELDLPPRLGRSQLKVDSRFHLGPLVAAQAAHVRACIALVNRLKARVFEMNAGEAAAEGATIGHTKEDFRQRPDLEFGPLPKTGRSDGYLGYEAGHRERHAENEIKNHFKLFAESLQMLFNRERFEALLIGCHEDAWPDLEPLLGNDLKKRLASRFVVDPCCVSAEEVREHARRILEERHRTQLQTLLKETLGEAQRHGRGAVGLRRVLIALERQEVQTLILGEGFKAEGSECPACGHVDLRIVRSCAVCSHETRHLNDLADALVDLALRNGADIEFGGAQPDLAKAGHVAALLRFRASQNKSAKMAA